MTLKKDVAGETGLGLYTHLELGWHMQQLLHRHRYISNSCFAIVNIAGIAITIVIVVVITVSFR